MSPKKPVLVTGGAGFIGTNLAPLLLDRGYDLKILDNFSHVGPEMIESATGDYSDERLDIVEGNVRDKETVAEAVRGVGAVVHLAAFTNVPESVKNPEPDVLTNSLGTFHVLEAARHADSCDGVVFASSNAAVGEVEGAVDETRVPEPLAPYGASKLHGEGLCSVYWHSYDLHTTSLRFANAYGPYCGHKTSVVAKFLRRAKQGKDLEIYGDGEQTRDFIHAEDIARVITRALQRQHNGGEVFQVATANETRILDLAHWVQTIAADHGQEIKVVHDDPRPGEIRFNYSSIDKVEETLGWEPKKKLKPSLESLWEAEGSASVTADF